MADIDVSATVSSVSSSPVTSCDLIPSNLSQTNSSPQTSQSISSTSVPRIGTPRFPVRIGITWRKGEKLEAMDFSRTWYPSKIVEIDEAAKYVLIHFEGWNQRYDEWVAMDSDKLRPVTRHSERKDKGVKKRRIHPHPIYRAGEKVLAKWTDCKKYPAKISRLKEDGMYEVIFYDGVTRLIQPMNIQPLPEDMQDARTQPPPDLPPPPKTKLSFKQIKITLPESVKRVKEKLDKSKQLSEAADLDDVPEDATVHDDKNKISSGRTAFVNKLLGGGAVLGKSKLSTTSRLLDKRRRRFKSKKAANILGTSKSMPGLDRDQTRGTPRTNKRGPYTWKIKKLQKLPVEYSQSETSTLPQSECSKGPISSTDVISIASTSSSISAVAPRKSLLMKDINAPSSFQAQFVRAVAEQMVGETPSTSNEEAQMFGVNRTKRRYNTVPKLHSKHRRMRIKSKEEGARTGGLTKRPPSLGQVDRAKSLDGGSVIANTSANIPLPFHHFVPSKAFIVEEDHNPFKCPHQGCNKDFRKENLLAYHIKYYHTEPETASGSDAHAGVTSPLLHSISLQSPGGTPGSRRRRKKTSSICSTDSDVSISSRGKSSSKRQRHDSEIPITASPDVLNKDLWADVKPLRTSQDSMAEESVAVDTEDEEMESDVVNCVCGHRETNGLMIQCDVCMCWQHFACMDTTNSGVPPTNYVCQVCDNTPGIRESCRYLYDMGWERRGELPSFPFIKDSSAEHLKSIACECNEMISALQAIKASLYSTRRQIKISKEDADQEFQLWQTDWDNWTKPEEDLTLTPCSGDPDPSPTPSTFLFPQAPCSSTLTASTEIFSSDVSSDPLLQSSASVPYVNTSGNVIQSSSSLQNSCVASSLTSAVTKTIEVESLLKSPPPMSQPSQLPQLEETSTSNIIPPSGSSLMDSLSSVSSNAAIQTSHGNGLSAQRQVINNIDGLTGVGLQSSSAGQNVNSETVSAIQRTENEHQSPTDEGLPENCDNSYSNKSSMQLESQPCARTLITSQPRGMFSAASDQPVSNGVNTQPKPRMHDMTESAISSDPATLGEAGAERQSQQLPSNGDQQDNTPSTTWTETSKHMSSLYVEVSGNRGLQVGCPDDDDDDAPDNDTDTAEESLDPYRNCEHNLLVHINRVHSDIEKQLEIIEQQIADLENSEHHNPTVQLSEDNVLNDVPALKKSLNKLFRNMVKVQRFCALH